MPVPATTGQLRTKVSDMKIGDYIYGAYDATNGWTLGSQKGTEFPLSGVGNPPTTGWYYVIKIAKGLLCADRVCLNTISWDSLNGTSKVIQGRPWDNGNIIPTMTSNTAPSGVASASSIYGAAFDAYEVFDRGNSSGKYWMTSSGVQSGWVEYEFPTATNVTGYSVTFLWDGTVADRAPKTWTFEAYDETTGSWIVLDTQNSQMGWIASQKRKFSIANISTYKKYRLNVSSNNGSTVGLAIAELEMFDQTIGIIRSLTGGVAYADANGNSSTANNNYGFWPLNNEWDKYIANFPENLIQPGKTIDDIFHWDGDIATWCQETPIIALSTNTGRCARGKFLYSGTYSGGLKSGTFSTSSNSGTTWGFRPVFAYREV